MLLAALLAVAQPAQNPPSPPARSTSASELGYLTAGELSDRCSVVGAPADISYCFAYIAAVHDAMRAYEVWLGVKEFCAPVGVTQSELRRSFLTYVTAYPTNRSGQAASVIVVALKETYPCVSGPQNGNSTPPSTKPKKR